MEIEVKNFTKNIRLSTQSTIQIIVVSMTLHNYIEKTLHDDLAFVKFDCKLNFAPDDVLVDVIAHSENHKYQRLFRMDFVHDGITNSLMGQ